MLQIISGKFFKSDSRHRFDAFGILYSNVSTSVPISTPWAMLNPVDAHGSVAEYVVTYTNQIERDAETGGITIARTGDEEVVRQFGSLLMLGLRGFFASNRRDVEHACRVRPITANDYVPSQLFDRFCDARLTLQQPEIQSCESLVRQAVGLRRRTYVAVMAYLDNFANALVAASTNTALAYSMLMYGLESLSQRFGSFQPVWSDYEPKIAKTIDAILAQTPALREEVREALLLSTPLRTQQRTASFVNDLLPNSFFEGEALRARKLPLRRSLVKRAIRNAYSLRSKFVHELQRDDDLHRWGPQFDCLTRRFDPWLTLRGLVRVSAEVIREFIARQEQVATEDLDWRSELPGVATVELAPQYWIWRAESFKPQDGPHRLSGFLAQVEAALSEGQPLTDLRDLLSKIEFFIKKRKGSAEQLRAMAVIYVLFHAFVGPSPQLGPLLEDHDVKERAEELLGEDCSIEAMVCDLLRGLPLRGERDKCAAVLSAYHNERNFKTSVNLPPQIEAALLAEVGNSFLEPEQELEVARHWFQKARQELAGYPEKQRYLEDCDETALPAERIRMLRRWPEQASGK